mgnify:CR=1 FL=1
MHFSFADVNQERLFPALAGAVYIFSEEAMNLKDRKRQRENRRIKQREKLIDKRNDCGVKDLTAYNAVRQIMTNGKANSFIALVRKHTDIRELNAEIIREFVERIEVFQAERVCDKKVQKLRIVWNCIGSFNPPQPDGKGKTA